ncbi:MAG: hypothetical protein BWK76_17465 [Desulfobulbaceae bacterium A2]|nr:MAG: hypothetical protein BWK76_17465 [Desulfobulbaceae bacterium A2]
MRDGVLDLPAVVRHFEDLYRSDSSISVAELTVTRPRRTQTMTLKSWTRGRDKSLIVLQEPVRDAGTSFLKVGSNLWNFLPRIRQTIRIPPSMMQASWMGSDFTNDDLVRESSFSEDYSSQLLGRSEEPAGWLVGFAAKPGLIGLWNRIELTLSDDGTIPLRTRYYDRKNRLARTMIWDEVREFDGRRLPVHMTLIPEDEPQHKTEMRYLSIAFDVAVPESTFSLSNLERHR